MVRYIDAAQYYHKQRYFDAAQQYKKNIMLHLINVAQ